VKIHTVFKLFVWCCGPLGKERPRRCALQTSHVTSVAIDGQKSRLWQMHEQNDYSWTVLLHTLRGMELSMSMMRMLQCIFYIFIFINAFNSRRSVSFTLLMPPMADSPFIAHLAKASLNVTKIHLEICFSEGACLWAQCPSLFTSFFQLFKDRHVGAA
jgi:hypothetical protein